MANEYTISKIALPNGDICNIKNDTYEFNTAYNATTNKGASMADLTMDNIKPIQSQTYTNVNGVESSIRYGTFYFMSLYPNSWEQIWHIKYHIHIIAPETTKAETDSIVEYWGIQNTITAYKIWNASSDTSKKPMYYHTICYAAEKGYNDANHYPHFLGVTMYGNGWEEQLNYYKNITVDLLQYDYCTVELLSTLKLPDNISGLSSSANYYSNTLTSQATYTMANGLNETGDSDDTYWLRRNAGGYVNSSGGKLYRYQLVFETDESTLTPLNYNNNVTGTTKTMLTNVPFNPFGPIQYYGSTAIKNAGEAVTATNLYFVYTCDLRYSFNITTSTLTANKAVYLKCSPVNGGKVVIASADPLTQDLPLSEDGYVYIYLGRAYNGYCIELEAVHPIYEYIDGGIQLYTNSAKTLGGHTEAEVAFYGLATAAGDTTQASSENAVGTYTNGAKSAIRSMLDFVGDVQVNSTSVVDSNGVANIPVATSNVPGVVCYSSSYGLELGSGTKRLYINKAVTADIKAGTDLYKPIVPYNQHEAVFYGLAKAAGDTTQASSSNAVGTYTTEAKTAIKQMLDISASSGGGGILDVQMNGSSIVSNSVASIPAATTSAYGVVQIGYGLRTVDNRLSVNPAGASEIKGGTSTMLPVTPQRQHEAVFYGLAKAAGDATQGSSSNSVGTYTDNAKTAIRQMLGIPNFLIGDNAGKCTFSSTEILLPTISTSGVTEIGRYLDFHKTSDNSQDYIVRIEGNDEGLFISPLGLGHGKNKYSEGNISGTQYIEVSVNAIPAGTYTFSAVVTSTDTDANYSLIYFMRSNGDIVGWINSPRSTNNERINAGLSLTDECIKIGFYASSGWSQSDNDTFSFTNIQIEEGSTATSYEPYTYPCSLQINGGAGNISLYSGGSTKGNRGIWIDPHGTDTNGKYIIKVDTDNTLYYAAGRFEGITTFYQQSSTVNNLPAGIHFSVKDTSLNYTNTEAHIYAYSPHNSTSVGTNMVIHSGGNLFIGSGEAPDSLYALYTLDSSENTYITSDNSIYLQSKAQTINERCGFKLNASHQLIPIVADIETDNIGSIGTASYKIQHLYASNVHTNAISSISGAALNLNAGENGNIIMGINNTTYNVQIKSTKDSTSPTTGALVVGGGIGTGGNIVSEGHMICRADIRKKTDAVDLTAADNGYSQYSTYWEASSNVYGAWPKLVETTDISGNRISAVRNFILSDGRVGIGLSINNFLTGQNASTEVHALRMYLSKDGTTTYIIANPANFRTALGIKYEDVNQGSKTIGSNGYVALTKPSSGTPIMAMVSAWSSNSTATTLAVAYGGNGTWYLTGTAGAVIQGLIVRYLFVG